MERKILYIDSCREDVVEKFSYLLRELGKRTKRPLWGKGFSREEEIRSLLYLDSGGRGNLDMMARSMGADIVEYIFSDEITGECFLLLSEKFKSEYKDGELVYKSTKKAGETLGNRIKAIEALYGCREVFAVEASPLEKSPVYSSLKCATKKNITNACFWEGNLAQLMKCDKLPSVIIADVFSVNGVFALMENLLGKPLAVHIMTEDSEIYAPYTSLKREIFIETEEFVKEALFAVCRWLSDYGEEKSGKRLRESYSSLSRGEELIERTCKSFMSVTKRKR